MRAFSTTASARSKSLGLMRHIPSKLENLGSSGSRLAAAWASPPDCESGRGTAAAVGWRKPSSDCRKTRNRLRDGSAPVTSSEHNRRERENGLSFRQLEASQNLNTEGEVFHVSDIDLSHAPPYVVAQVDADIDELGRRAVI